MILALVILGLLIEIGLGAYVLLLTHQEKKTLRALVEKSVTDFRAASLDLPEPYRTVSKQLSDEIESDANFDHALLDTVVEVTRQPFKKPLWMRLTVGAICSIAFLAPASCGLMATASQLVAAWNESKELDRSLFYLRSQTELESSFLLLRDAFRGSALLFFGLAFLWALAWYLRRPEVREARFVRALLEAAARASPRSAAPVAGRLSELIAPDRGLARPVTALVICFFGITAGWLVLYRTADVRAANIRPPVFHVWPKKKERPVYIAEELQLPSSRGGSPISTPPPPSLIIGQEKVTLMGGTTLIDLEEGRLPEGWRDRLLDDPTKRLLEAAKGRLVLAAHREHELALVLEVMDYLHQLHGIRRFDLILERTVQTGDPGGKTLQAAIPVEVDAKKTVGLVLALEETGIRLAPGAKLQSYEDGGWKEELASVVRDKAGLLRNADREVVRLDVQSRAIGYGRFAEVLGAADTACLGTVDCGLPGLGLEFTLSPAAPSP